MKIKIRNKYFDFSKKPHIMGILNITQDSFYDGGRYIDPDIAVAHAREMIEQGCDIIDIGGESTKPGSSPINADEEIRRVIPVIKAVRNEFPEIPISLDTYKPEVLDAGLENGIDIINDVYALRFHPDMPVIAAQSNKPVILMHMQNIPQNMQENPQYYNILDDIKSFLRHQVQIFINYGGSMDNVILDPGIGFGKSLHHNLQIINNLERIRFSNRPILVGLSRKSFLEKLLGRHVDERLAGTTAFHVIACMKGANILRVHDISQTMDSIKSVLSVRMYAGSC